MSDDMKKKEKPKNAIVKNIIAAILILAIFAVIALAAIAKMKAGQ